MRKERKELIRRIVKKKKEKIEMESEGEEEIPLGIGS